jgi:putative copper resistance protein D
MSEAIDWTLVAARFATFGLAILLFGSALFPVLTPAAGAAGWRARLAAAALALAAGTYLALLACEASGVAGWPGADVVVQLAVGIGFGRALTVTAACAFALALGGGANRWARLALSGVALASLAFVGHAADGEGAAGALRIAVMALHLLAAGAWLGALAPLVAAITGDPATAFATLKRFGALGVIAVFVIVATGLCSVAFVAAARGMLGLAYLRTLGVKLALAAVLLGVAGLNRWRLTPLAADQPDRAVALLRRTVILEQALGAGIVACVALLGQLDPTM